MNSPMLKILIALLLFTLSFQAYGKISITSLLYSAAKFIEFCFIKRKQCSLCHIWGYCYWMTNTKCMESWVLGYFFSGQFEEWCIADEQTPDEELQRAMDWACEKGGADCSKIKVNQPCYLPNTLKDHASYAFNNYYQRFKHKGASCYFNAAAITTDLDPSKISR